MSFKSPNEEMDFLDKKGTAYFIRLLDENAPIPLSFLDVMSHNETWLQLKPPHASDEETFWVKWETIGFFRIVELP